MLKSDLKLSTALLCGPLENILAFVVRDLTKLWKHFSIKHKCWLSWWSVRSEIHFWVWQILIIFLGKFVASFHLKFQKPKLTAKKLNFLQLKISNSICYRIKSSLLYQNTEFLVLFQPFSGFCKIAQTVRKHFSPYIINFLVLHI